jgi:hypothetical protein
VVVTADPNIYRNPGLRAAWEQAAKIVKWWPNIMGAVRRAKKGAGFVVRVNGAVEPWTDD